MNKRTTSGLTALVLDDHPLVCMAIKKLMEQNPRFGQVLVETDTQAGVKMLREGQIDFLVLDVNLEKQDGFEVLRRLKHHGFTGKTLFVSGNNSRLYSETALRVGADGYVSKAEDLSILQDAVECILNGYSFFKVAEETQAVDIQLSKQELAVFRFLVDGKSNKEIAQILNLSPKTISTYKTRILDKYQVNSIVELMSLNSSVIGRIEL
ncbi:response regulator [Vibrio fluvialis]|nr:response regulator transcription factor [Vibrio fluvialis]